jgi:hypothetical protein
MSESECSASVLPAVISAVVIFFVSSTPWTPRWRLAERIDEIVDFRE